MNTYFLEYRDPLFGIMAFLLLALIVAIGAIVASKIKNDKQISGVKRFLQNFPTKNTKDYVELLEAHPDSFELLLNVARTYFEGGDLEKSIKIYLALLEWVSPFNKEKKAFILEAMGDIYTKGGFLQRSVEAYEKSLSILPRNQGVLRKVALLYDKRGEFDKALEAIEALEELGVDEALQKEFLTGLLKLKKASHDERLLILRSLSEHSVYFAREYLKELLQSDIQLADEFLQGKSDVEFVDVLWGAIFEKPSDFEPKSVLMSAVMSAKALGKQTSESGIFELDAMSVLAANAKELNADLNFEFVCQKCGHVDIDYFFSCKNCGTVGSCKVAPSISKGYASNPMFLDSW